MVLLFLYEIQLFSLCFPSLYSLSLSHSSLQLSGAVIAPQSQIPSEESTWNFSSMRGILASQFSLIFVALRVGNPTGSLLEIFRFHELKNGEGIFASKLFFLFLFLSLKVTRSKHFSYPVGESSLPAVNGSWWCGREPIAGTQNTWIKAASLQVHI